MNSKFHGLALSASLAAVLFGGVSTAYSAERRNSHSTIASKTKKLIQNEVVALFNHPSSFYDGKLSAKEGTRGLHSLVRKSGIPSILLLGGVEGDSTDIVIEADQAPMSSYYVTSRDVDLTIKSLGGAHELVLPRLRTAIFSGGYVELCLCEAIRDTIKGAFSRKRSTKAGGLELILVREAIFDGVNDFQSPSYGATEFEEYVKNSLFLYSSASISRDEDSCQQNSERKTPYYLTNFQVSVAVDYGEPKVIRSGDGNQILVRLMSLKHLKSRF